MSQRHGRSSQQVRTDTQGIGSSSSSSSGGGGSGAQIQIQSRLQGIRSDLSSASELLEQAIRSCTVTALDLTETDAADKVDELDLTLRQLLDTQHMVKLEQELVGQTAHAADLESAAPRYTRAWEKERSAYSEKSNAEKYATSALYREFKQQIWDLKHDGEPMPRLFHAGGGGEEESDEDLVISGAKLTYKCPVSQSWLIDPMTSKLCGHSFSKDAILAYVRSQRGGSAKCPVGGCASIISPRDLFSDAVLERKVAHHLRQLEQEEASVAYTMVQ
ncbi:hypothetical protein LPJ66_006572 [Kickxella alabastrina]|uniref:Uncharacterized protein n=1 Tax=Kickxella alabastrina TaxID=61397 RepID=A0ACC1IBJ2_9FUNG|nr:hypothetical protein LPJ66_006572 [Kickxella alabastrina]